MYPVTDFSPDPAFSVFEVCVSVHHSVTARFYAHLTPLFTHDFPYECISLGLIDQRHQENWNLVELS